MAPFLQSWSAVVLLGSLVCVGPGQVSGGPLLKVAEEQQAVSPKAFLFYIKITNRMFNNTLQDPSTEYARTLQSQVDRLMEEVFKCPSCPTHDSYVGASEMTFKQGGSSVIVKMKLVFNSLDVDSMVVRFLFITKMAVQPPEDLQIDLQYTRGVQPPVPVMV